MFIPEYGGMPDIQTTMPVMDQKQTPKPASLY